MSTPGNVTLLCAAHTRGQSLTGFASRVFSRRDGSRHVVGVGRQRRRRGAKDDASLRDRRLQLLRRRPRPLAGQLTSRAAISDGGAAFHVFGCLFDGGRKVASPSI